MIISRTPFRISFFGGGTDYPVWYRQHGGAVLATTIDKYCYLSCRYLPPFFEHRSRVVYSKVETVKSNDHIEHPAVRGTLQYMEIQEGVEIHHDADLPARAGLGSSSSFSVGLLHTLFALRRTMPTKTQLATAAIHVEQDILKEQVGCQDQVLAAFGGFLRINFHAGEREFEVAPVIINRERLRELQDHMLLYFTGRSRIASEVAKDQVARMSMNIRQLSIMRQMVDQAIAILTGGGALTEFGALLHEGWMLKRSLSPQVSAPLIDDAYESARAAGAIGGKLLGAGGGGFMLLFAKPEDHLRIRERLSSFLCVPFCFEQTGSQIMVFEPEASWEGRVTPSGFSTEAVTAQRGR